MKLIKNMLAYSFNSKRTLNFCAHRCMFVMLSCEVKSVRVGDRYFGPQSQSFNINMWAHSEQHHKQIKEPAKKSQQHFLLPVEYFPSLHVRYCISFRKVETFDSILSIYVRSRSERATIFHLLPCGYSTFISKST
jgi:hypothetical protein